MPQLQLTAAGALSNGFIHFTCPPPYIEAIACALEAVAVLVIAFVVVFDSAQPAKSFFTRTKQSFSHGENLDVLHRSNKVRVEERVVALEGQHKVCSYVRRRKGDDFQLTQVLV